MLTSNEKQIGAALGRIPSGCAIRTAEHGGWSTGTLVSWFQQVAFEPPSLSVVLRRNRPIGTLIDGCGRFVLNLIGPDVTELFKHFGKGFAQAQPSFEGIATTPSEYGPQLNDAIASLGCTVIAKHPSGDHELYIAKVEAAHANDDSQPYVHLRKTGFSY